MPLIVGYSFESILLINSVVSFMQVGCFLIRILENNHIMHRYSLSASHTAIWLVVPINNLCSIIQLPPERPIVSQYETPTRNIGAYCDYFFTHCKKRRVYIYIYIKLHRLYFPYSSRIFGFFFFNFIIYLKFIFYNETQCLYQYNFGY